MLKLAACLLVVCILLSGCFDAREIDDEVYAISIGIDKGTKNTIRLTIQYATYAGGGQQSGSSGMENPNMQGDSIVQTIECPSVLEGIDMFGMAISRRISLMHAKMVVFSEEFAKEGVGIYLAPIERYRETRGSMAVVVTRGSAEEFIKEVKSNIGGTISKAVELMFLQAKYNNYFPYIQFNEFYKNIISSYQQPIAIYGDINDFKNKTDEKSQDVPMSIMKGYLPGEIPRRGVTKIEYAGVAVFNGDKMEGALDFYECTYYLILIGKFKTGAITFKDPNAPENVIVLDIRSEKKPKIKAYFQDGKPVIDINLKIESDIESIQSRINYEEEDLHRELTDYAKKILTDNMYKLIEKVQKELGSDIFGFGRYMAGNFKTIQEWEEYNWFSHFPEAQVNLELDLHIRRSGMMTRSSPIWTRDGKEKADK